MTLYDSAHGYNCGAPIYTPWLFCVFGIVALAAGGIAWGLPVPFSRTIRAIVDLDGNQAWVWRVVGPIIGAAFTIAGIFMVILSLQCPHINWGIPDFRDGLSFVGFPLALVAPVISGAFGVYNSRGLQNVVSRVIYVLCGIAYGFPGGQVLFFAGTVHEGQWIAITLVTGLLGSIIQIGLGILDVRDRREAGQTVEASPTAFDHH